MNARYLWMEIREAGGALVLVFCLSVFLGLLWGAEELGKQFGMSPQLPHQDWGLRVVTVAFQALVTTVVFVPAAFVDGQALQGEGSRLSTLTLLPMSRLSLALQRYGPILVLQIALFLLILVLEPVVASTMGTTVMDGSMGSLLSRVFLSFAIVAVYQMATVFFPDSRTIVGSLFLLVLIFSLLGGFLRADFLESPVTIGVISCALVAVELGVFIHRRCFLSSC